MKTGRLMRISLCNLVIVLGIGFAGKTWADQDQVVMMSGFAYNPVAVSVDPGQTIQWTNQDAAAHTVISDPGNPIAGGPNSDTLFPTGFGIGGTYSWTVPANAVAGTTWYYHCRFHGFAGNGSHLGAGMVGMITVNATTPPPTAVGPVITANGSTNDISINSGTNLSIAVKLNAGQFAGFNVDWWIVALANSSWFYLNNSTQWTPFDGNLSNCHPVHEGPLFDLPTTTVLDTTALNITLPAGSYTFWFAVDYPMDGILNINGPILYDSVKVIVLPSGPILVSATSLDRFDPALINVRPGQVVMWHNADIDPHTVFADSANIVSGGPNSDAEFPTGIPADSAFSWTVPETAVAGTAWYYHCRFHGAAGDGHGPGTGMVGTIMVQ